MNNPRLCCIHLSIGYGGLCYIYIPIPLIYVGRALNPHFTIPVRVLACSCPRMDESLHRGNPSGRLQVLLGPPSVPVFVCFTAYGYRNIIWGDVRNGRLCRPRQSCSFMIDYVRLVVLRTGRERSCLYELLNQYPCSQIRHTFHNSHSSPT